MPQLSVSNREYWRHTLLHVISCCPCTLLGVIFGATEKGMPGLGFPHINST